MKVYRSLGLAGGILMLALYNAGANAEQVQMYDRPPSAEEMGRVLFGHQTKPPTSTGMKMRSISFGSKASSGTSDTEIAQRAEVDQRASIGLPIQFAFNSANILPESVPFLEEIGRMLTMDGYADKQLIIEGHTDASGGEDYNLQLSRLRAEAVKNFLTRNYKIADYRLYTKGLGESKPLSGRNPFDGINRRVQFYSAN